MDYPELYYRTYPKVVAIVNKYLEAKLEIEEVEREVTQDEMDDMINQVYIEIVDEYPEIHGDPYERRLKVKMHRQQSRAFYGRSRILRDLISILLISELLMKNRRLYPI